MEFEIQLFFNPCYPFISELHDCPFTLAQRARFVGANALLPRPKILTSGYYLEQKA
jgi:hypothetical protein